VVRLDDRVTQLVALTQDDQTLHSVIEFWDLATLQKTAEFHESSMVTSLALAGSGDFAMSGVLGMKAVRLWRKSGTSWTNTAMVTGFPITAIDISPDSRSVALSGDVGDAELWNTQPQFSRRLTLPNSPRSRDTVFAAGGRLIAAKNSVDKTMRLWQAQDGTPQAPIEFPKTPSAIATSEGPEVIVSDNGNIEILDVERRQLLRRLAAPTIGSQVLGLSGTGQRLLIADKQDHVSVVDFSSALKLRDGIEGKSPLDQLRWFTACGLIAPSGTLRALLASEPQAETLEDAYAFWAGGDIGDASRIFAAKPALSDGERGLLLRAILSDMKIARMPSP
jgi:hypothetical protein